MHLDIATSAYEVKMTHKYLIKQNCKLLYSVHTSNRMFCSVFSMQPCVKNRFMLKAGLAWSSV